MTKIERISAETLLDTGHFTVHAGVFDVDGDEIRRSWIEPKDVVGVLPFSKGHVHLAQQPREVTGRDSLGLCAGAIDPGETAFAAAKRELAEELGLESSFWYQIGTFYSSEGVMTEKVSLFLAGKAHFLDDPALDLDERVTMRSFRLEYLDELITNADTIKLMVALQALRHNLLREKIKKLLPTTTDFEFMPVSWPPEAGWGVLEKNAG